MGERPPDGSTSLDAALAEALLRTSGALTLVLAPDGTVLRWGEACERVTGWAAAERVGRPIWDLLVPEEREAVEGVFSRLAGKALPSQHENFWVTRLGERRLVAWSNTAVIGEDELGAEYVIPSVFNREVAPAVAAAVAETAEREGVARRKRS